MKQKTIVRLTSMLLSLGLLLTATTLPTLAGTELFSQSVAKAVTDGKPNLAINATGTSNGYDTNNDGGPYIDEYANDGDLTTRWQSNIKVNGNILEEEATYTLDFHENTTMDYVKIVWEAARPSEGDGYVLMSSKNGSDWTEVSAVYTYNEQGKNEIDNDTFTDTATFDFPVTARYLRVSVFKIFDKYAPSIFEIEVYNLSGTEVKEELKSDYYIDKVNKYILNVPAEVSVSDFKSKFKSEIFVDANGSFIGTGDTVSYNNEVYTVIIFGDPSGDGKVNSTDFMQIRRKFLGLVQLDDIKLKAADVNGDGNVNSTDFMQVRRHFLGLYNIFDNMIIPDEPEEPDHLMESPTAETVVGEMLYLTASPNKAQSLCNNTGMSGIEAPNHMTAALSSTKDNQKSIVEESMYLSATTSPLTFDIGHIEALGGLFIWNYNDTARLDCGMKDVIISYSSDNKTYTELGQFTLAKCSAFDNAKYGGNVATNTVNENRAIDFGGIPARYIRITPLTNYGGNGFGLSEIRIFRHKTTPAKGDMIMGEGICQNADFNATNAANNTGISELFGTADSKETVSNNPNDMWLSTSSAKDSTFIFHLDGTYPINCIKLWNYNDPNNLGSGIKSFDLYTTTSEACNIKEVENGKDILDYSQGSWIKIGTYTLPQGTGEDSMTVSQTIRLINRHVQHIKIVPNSNYGGSGFGLSEIRVYAGTGWAVEADRNWSGLLSSSGSFRYQGNTSSNPLGDRDNGYGWIAGDGCFTTPADSDTILFTFQDSFLGNFGNYSKFDPLGHGYGDSGGFTIPTMKNMAYAVLNGKTPDPRNFQMYHELNNGLSNYHPAGNIYPEGFWLADSTVINNTLYIIAGQISGGWGNGVFDLYKQALNSDGSFNMNQSPSESVDGTSNFAIAGKGTTVTEYSFNSIYDEADDGYIYLYGEFTKNDLKRLGVARVKESDFTSMRNVTYWAGSRWSSNVNDTAAISNFIPGGEANVTYMEEGPFAGKYVHIGTENGGYGSIFGTIVIATSDSLTGPFKQPSEHKLYWSPERYQIYQSRYYERDDYYQQWNYNAKAQPAISEKGELYITYHYGVHDDRAPGWNHVSGAVTKEYEHPSFIRMFEIKNEVN